jgi:hypothetical protein
MNTDESIVLVELDYEMMILTNVVEMDNYDWNLDDVDVMMVLDLMMNVYVYDEKTMLIHPT